ncbi:MaoC family dehydratase N-terminal domain-containing protein [candidate division KSB1 bacterium]|nr:MaoC family dehydratase N-terminal domain-containing protein [candidate division KSB1 bacterium]
MQSDNWKLLVFSIKNFRQNTLNRALIGHTVENISEPIQREDILAYATATSDHNPAYESAHPIVPPFFLTSLFLPVLKKIWFDNALKLNIFRMVHAQQDIHWHHPIHCGDQLRIIGTIRDIIDTPAGELLEISVEAFRTDKLVAEGKTGLIVRKKRDRAKLKSPDNTASPVTMRIKIKTEKDQPRQYAAASGDYNLIHTSKLAAKLAGLPAPIMHGTCVMAMSCAALVEARLNNDNTRLSGISGRFARPTIPGENLTLVGYETPERNCLPFEVLNMRDEKVIKNGMLKFHS